MSEPRTVVVNVPLNRGSDAEAIDVSLEFGGYGVQLRYISVRGRPKLTAMVTPDRARLLARALVHAADASDQKARGTA